MSEHETNEPRSDPRDYILDLSSQGGPGKEEQAPTDAATGRPSGARDYLSVFFRCCHVYQRVYKTPDGRAYAGHCPRCAKSVRFEIGPGGTTARVFEAF